MKITGDDMELLTRLEKKVLSFSHTLPNLPTFVRKWIAENIWWIVLVGVIISAIGALMGLQDLLRFVSVVDRPIQAIQFGYRDVTDYKAFTAIVEFVLSVIVLVLAAIAIKPLQLMQKKGWVLLFAAWLLSVASIVINGVLTLDAFSLIFSLIFGAIFSAITGYFLFEIHGQFGNERKIINKTTKKP